LYVSWVQTFKVPLRQAYAVAQVKGVSASLANAILKKAGVNPDLRVGFIADSDVAKIEDVIRDPAKYGIPGGCLTAEKTAIQEKTCTCPSR
jgi:ribosomal protein S13